MAEAPEIDTKCDPQLLTHASNNAGPQWSDNGDLEPPAVIHHPMFIPGGYPDDDETDFMPYNVGEGGFPMFHRYDSNDIVYEIPRPQAKIVGNRYLKGELLGEGSYSKVKEMLDCQTLCRRAVKIMKQRKLRRIPNGEQNVRREIAILRKLNHKNVIKLVDVLEDLEKQKLYVVLEYCIGGLQEMLDKAPHNKFPMFQAHKYFVQLIDGLEYLHSRSVVHKDIKPGNLLLTTDETVKICDFGVAEELDHFSVNDECQNCQGSPAFQPPEIAAGTESWSGFKADIWASGVTLFQFTIGRLPFEGENIYKLFGAISTGEFTIPTDIPYSLQDLIKGLLAKDPQKRMTIVEIRHQPWVLQKQPKPLPSELVRFPAYVGSEDSSRGTTVLPYLEVYYNYNEDDYINLSSGAQATSQPGASTLPVASSQPLVTTNHTQIPNIAVTQSDSDSRISQYRSRIPSQENVLFPLSRSLETLDEQHIKHKQKKKRSLVRMMSETQCHQQ